MSQQPGPRFEKPRELRSGGPAQRRLESNRGLVAKNRVRSADPVTGVNDLIVWVGCSAAPDILSNDVDRWTCKVEGRQLKCGFGHRSGVLRVLVS